VEVLLASAARELDYSLVFVVRPLVYAVEISRADVK
jgi:hypothetical protein